MGAVATPGHEGEKGVYMALNGQGTAAAWELEPQLLGGASAGVRLRFTREADSEGSSGPGYSGPGLLCAGTWGYAGFLAEGPKSGN